MSDVRWVILRLLDAAWRLAMICNGWCVVVKFDPQQLFTVVRLRFGVPRHLERTQN
jgi:hypothetical protein